MTMFESDAPPCQQCGGPLGAKNGQTFTWTTTMTLDENGALVSVEEHSGWCGQCVADWNEAMGAGETA